MIRVVKKNGQGKPLEMNDSKERKLKQKSWIPSSFIKGRHRGPMYTKLFARTNLAPCHTGWR